MPTMSESFIAHILATMEGMVEKQRRLYLGSIAKILGYGGISALSKAVKVSRSCIQRGVAEVKAGEVYHYGDRSRAVGGGRKGVAEKHREAVLESGLFSDEPIPEVIDIMKLVDGIVRDSSYGDPMRDNAWINVTKKSVAEAVYEKTGQRYSHACIKKNSAQARVLAPEKPKIRPGWQSSPEEGRTVPSYQREKRRIPFCRGSRHLHRHKGQGKTG